MMLMTNSYFRKGRFWSETGVGIEQIKYIKLKYILLRNPWGLLILLLLLLLLLLLILLT